MTPYYQDDLVTIYHGDCRAILGAIPLVDLVFTSPPYNLGTSVGGAFEWLRKGKKLGHYAHDARLGKRGGTGKWSGGSLAHGYGAHDDAMPHDEYVLWQKSILRLCWERLSDTGAIYYNHKPRIQDGLLITPLWYIPEELEAENLRQIVIWARAGGMNFTQVSYVPTHEWIVIIAKPDFRLRDQSASGVGDVWRVAQQTGDIDHPAPFPVALPARAIETTTAQLILDPFMGSGTTLVAAKAAGRRAIGIEIEERYCEIAAQRLSQATLGLDVPA